MADQPQEFAPESTDPEPRDERRSFTGVIVTVIAIVLVVLALLLMRSCKPAEEAAAGRESGAKTIESVQGLDPEPGAVSVWVVEGGDINAALSLASVRADDVADMGGGRFVIAVPVGTEAVVVAKLLRTQRVVDAGLVYATGETQ